MMGQAEYAARGQSDIQGEILKGFFNSGFFAFYQPSRIRCKRWFRVAEDFSLVPCRFRNGKREKVPNGHVQPGGFRKNSFVNRRQHRGQVQNDEVLTSALPPDVGLIREHRAFAKVLPQLLAYLPRLTLTVSSANCSSH